MDRNTEGHSTARSAADSGGKSLRKLVKQYITVERLITLATVSLILLSWYVVSEKKVFSDVVIPPPGKVYNSFVAIVADGYKGNSLGQHLFDSMERLLLAFGFVVVTAIPIGLLSGYNSKIRAVFDPLVEFYRPLPPLAYYTMLVIWLGIENWSKISLLYLAAFPPVYLACVSGVQQIKQDYI